MKKLSKIFAVLLSLAILACVGAVIASAASESDAPFYINGEAWGDESKTLADAIAEANGGVVKLNSDVSVSASIAVSGDVRVDLGGKTINAAADPVFTVADGASLEIRGKGNIVTAGTVVSASNAARFEINAFGTGIHITHNAESAKTLFALDNTDSSYISGKITVSPKTHINSYYFITLGGTKTEIEANASTLTVEGAEIVFELPATDAKFEDISGMYFIYMLDGSKLVVNRSRFSLAFGNFVYAATGTAERINVTETNKGAGKNGTQIVTANKETIGFTKWIDIDSSEIRAYEGGYTRLNHSTGWGKLFNMGACAVEVKVDDTFFEGGNRSITAEEAYNNARVTGNKLYFTNVDYVSVNKTYNSSWVLGGDVNIVWNGGKVSHQNAYYGSVVAKIEIPEAKDGDNDIGPFGALAKAAVIAKLGDNLPAKFEELWGIWYAKKTTAKVDNVDKYYYEYYNSTSGGTGQFTYRGWIYSKVNDTWYGQKFSNLLMKDVVLPSTDAADSRNGAYGLMSGTKYENLVVYDENFKSTTYKYAYLDTPYNNHGIQNTLTTVYNPTNSSENIGFYGGSFNNRFGNWETVYSANGSNGYLRAYVDETNYVHGSDGANPYVEQKLGSGYVPLNGKTYVVQEIDISTDVGAYMQTNSTSVFFRNAGSTVTALADGNVSYALAGAKTPSFFALGIDGKLTISGEGNANSVKLPTDGTWTRLTFVHEIKSTASVASVTTGDYTSQYNQVTYTVRSHAFADGEWITTITTEIKFHEAQAKTGVLDVVRFGITNNYSQDGKGTAGAICLDNSRVSYYTAENDELKKLCAAPDQGISDASSELMILPRNNALAILDGEKYYNMEEAFADAKDGSTIELLADVDFNASVDDNFKIITNGYDIGGLISKTHKVVCEDGIIHIAAADSDEIKTIEFVNNDVEPAVSESYTAAYGTLIVPTTDFAAYEPSESLGFFVGWSLSDAENTLVLPYYYKGTPVAIYGEAAILKWHDALGELIMTTVSKVGAGIKPALPENLSYEPFAQTDNGWYDLELTGWTAALATELSEAKTYELYPDVKPIAPIDGLGVRGILINVAANVDFDLNVYIPAERPDEITRVILVNENGGSINYKRAISSETNDVYKDANGDYVHELVSVKGAPYEKYIDPYGVADAGIRTYRLIYVVNGTQITQEIEYGLPYYASTIMNGEGNEDAKSLVMHMINYSTTVIEYLGELEGENSGLAIYEGLMNRYSSLVTLEREEDYFISDENILASIADLNYNNSEYISSASFLFSTGEPAFVFKYSDAAEEVGIQRPGSSNYIGWTNGMFAYLAFANEDNQRPVQVFAYEGTIEDGTRLAYNDESWFDYEANSYYIVAKSYRHFENKSLYWSKHSVYNILGPVTMTVQNFDNTATEDVDESCAEAVTYSFAAYVNSLVTAHNEILASLETETDQVKIDALNAKSAEYKAAIDMSIALYAYAEAADAYVIR